MVGLEGRRRRNRCGLWPSRRSKTRLPRRLAAAVFTTSPGGKLGEERTMVTGISAVTLATHDMRRAVGFYRLLDLRLIYGGEEAEFTSFAAGDNYLNLIAQPAERRWSWWGRLILYHADLDALHARLTGAGWQPDF